MVTPLPLPLSTTCPVVRKFAPRRIPVPDNCPPGHLPYKHGSNSVSRLHTAHVQCKPVYFISCVKREPKISRNFRLCVFATAVLHAVSWHCADVATLTPQYIYISKESGNVAAGAAYIVKRAARKWRVPVVAGAKSSLRKRRYITPARSASEIAQVIHASGVSDDPIEWTDELTP